VPAEAGTPISRQSPLYETQDLAVGENRAIVTDDPKVNVHGRRHAGIFEKLQNDTAFFTSPNYQHPTVPVALVAEGFHVLMLHFS